MKTFSIFQLSLIILSIIVSPILNAQEKKKSTSATSSKSDDKKKDDVANPNEQLKENGLKCLLDILDKIEHDKSDGKFKGDLKNDGTHTDNIKLNQLFKVGVDQGIDLTTLLLQYFNLESKDIKITDGDKNFKINLRKAITDCRLNLDKALKRCEYAYSKLKGAVCERVRWGGDDEWGKLFTFLIIYRFGTFRYS